MDHVGLLSRVHHGQSNAGSTRLPAEHLFVITGLSLKGEPWF